MRVSNMINLCTILIIIKTVITTAELVSGTTSSGQYGTYKVDFSNYEICRGPKSTDAGNTSSVLYKEDGVYKAVINITLLGQTSIDEVKVMVYSNKDNIKNLLWSYKLDKPCQHIVVGAVINKFINTTKCIGNKGSLSTVIDFTEITYTFFGKTFFYGEYLFKALVASKKGNVLCMTMNAVFTKNV